MPYVPPRYAARDDWETLLHLGGGAANDVEDFLTELLKYWMLTRQTSHPLSPEDAWPRIRMSRDHAGKALSASAQPPSPRNGAGLIPPPIVRYIFARALANSVDERAEARVDVAHDLLPVREGGKVRSFIAPIYRPRADWEKRLKDMEAEEGSWQDDLARYWRLRMNGKEEEDAWREIAMSQPNAHAALMEDADSEDSGLIPWMPDGQETVARRVLARSVASNIDAADIYPKLVLEAP